MNDIVLKKDEKCFVMCDCYGHVLFLEKDEGLTYFSVYETAYTGGKLSWYERIRWCWNIILTGKPYTDSFVLNNNKSKELAKFLS